MSTPTTKDPGTRPVDEGKAPLPVHRSATRLSELGSRSDGCPAGEILGLAPRDVDLGIDMDGTAAELVVPVIQGIGSPFSRLSSQDSMVAGSGMRRWRVRRPLLRLRHSRPLSIARSSLSWLSVQGS